MKLLRTGLERASRGRSFRRHIDVDGERALEKRKLTATRLNLGCGRSPLAGWVNFDNSPAVLLSKNRALRSTLHRFRLIPSTTWEFAEALVDFDVTYGSCSKPLPFSDGPFELVYSSHMVEHLPRESALDLLVEVHRVLRPEGVVRLVLPDMRRLVRLYLENSDCDQLIERSLLARSSRWNVGDRLKCSILGDRAHNWMYDADGLCDLLSEAGFGWVQEVAPGETQLKDAAGIDLYEKADESFFVEASR